MTFDTRLIPNPHYLDPVDSADDYGKIVPMEIEVPVLDATSRRELAITPLPVVRKHPGKSWAGAHISNLDDAFGIGRLGRGMHGLDFSDTQSAELRKPCCD